MNRRLTGVLLTGLAFWLVSGMAMPLWALHVDLSLAGLGVAARGACPEECDQPYPGMDADSGCVVCFCGGENDPVTIEAKTGQECNLTLDHLEDETAPLELTLSDICFQDEACIPALLTCLETHCQLAGGYAAIRDLGQNIAFIPAGYDVTVDVHNARYDLFRYSDGESELLDISGEQGWVTYTFPWEESVSVGLVSDDCADCVAGVRVNLTEETITVLGVEGDGDTEEDETDSDDTDEDPEDPGETEDGDTVVDGDEPSGPWSPGGTEVDGGDEDQELDGITICRRECRCNQPMTTGFAWWLAFVSAVLGLWLVRRRA